MGPILSMDCVTSCNEFRSRMRGLAADCRRYRTFAKSGRCDVRIGGGPMAAADIRYITQDTRAPAISTSTVVRTSVRKTSANRLPSFFMPT